MVRTLKYLEGGSRTLIFAWSAIVSLSPMAASAQDDPSEIVVDIPVGAPFDGTSWRASPNDFEQVASIAYEAVVKSRWRAGHSEDMERDIASALHESAFSCETENGTGPARVPTQ